MARAARRAHRQAASAGLLILATACAVVQDPPGGPPDFDTPVLLEVRPDSGEIADSLDGPVVFQFDEVVAENSGGGLDRLFRFSPRTERLNVNWKRTRVEIRPREGWVPDRVYQITMLPGITDLRNNRMEEGRYVVFTTGGPVPDTRIEGDVLDWENGRVGARAAIEAVLLPDSLVYEAVADSVGHYRLEALPRGRYLLSAAIDENNNGQRDRREAFDSVTVTLDSTLERAIWAFAQDTTGPQLSRAVPVDSTTARLQFNKKLRPGDPADSIVRVWVLPDTVPVAVAALWDERTYDSLTTAARAAADSARAAAAADSLAALADSLAAAGDTAVAAVEDTPQAAPAPPSVPSDSADLEAEVPDSSAADRLLPTRPPLSANWFLRVSAAMPPGTRYLIEVVAQSVNLRSDSSRTVLVIPDAEDGEEGEGR